MNAIESSAPVLLQRLRKPLEAFNSGDSRWHALELCMTARFRDEVEWGLRNVRVASSTRGSMRGR